MADSPVTVRFLLGRAVSEGSRLLFSKFAKADAVPRNPGGGPDSDRDADDLALGGNGLREDGVHFLE